jgi:hypothetical protein
VEEIRPGVSFSSEFVCMMRPSRLAVARRLAYGSLERAARETGIPRSTQQKAEAGGTLADRTRHRIEQAYGKTLEALQEPFLEELYQ